MSTIVLAVMLVRGRAPSGWRLLALAAVIVDALAGIRATALLLTT
ncbi:hypothetical protein [Arenibaculum pallidiluteum]|nr:hypothetical protein [Arenibaculum pallidiluteum]